MFEQSTSAAIVTQGVKGSKQISNVFFNPPELESNQSLSLRTYFEVTALKTICEKGFEFPLQIPGNPESTVVLYSDLHPIYGEAERQGLTTESSGTNVENVISQHLKVLRNLSFNYKFVRNNLVPVPKNPIAQVVLWLCKRWLPKGWITIQPVDNEVGALVSEKLRRNTRFRELVGHIIAQSELLPKREIGILEAVESNEVSLYAGANLTDTQSDALHTIVTIYDELCRETPDEAFIEQSVELLAEVLGVEREIPHC